MGAKPRIRQVAADLVTHFEERSKVQSGKAMIVAMSREICVHLYNAIIALRPDWHDDDPGRGAIKIVMTGSASDKPLLRPHTYSKQTKKRLEKRFKDPECQTARKIFHLYGKISALSKLMNCICHKQIYKFANLQIITGKHALITGKN